MVTVSRASFHGRLRATGVTIVPIRMRSVRMAMAASAIQGSHIGAPGAAPFSMWSHMKKPAHPAASASCANSASARTSLYDPKFGTEMPYFIGKSFAHETCRSPGGGR
jgi:hypothetical protein